MKIFHTFIHDVKKWFSLSSADENQDIHDARFFFVIVTVVLGGVAALEVHALPAMRAPARLIPFVALMLLHITLYWFSPRFSDTLRRTVSYLAVQALLVFLITWYPRDLGIIMSLYPSLLGIAVGMMREKRRVALAVVLCLGLAAINLVLVLGWGALATWILFTPPMALFVVIYVVLYGRQAEARDRAQTLLRELETANSELAEYADRVEDLTLAAERQRMARELHDTLAQGVAGLILQLEAVDSHLSSGRVERAQSIVQQAMARARATLAEARQAIGDLREQPASPTDLESALREETERFTNATGISCALDLRLPDSLSDIVCEHALRVVAEALANIARHAQARHVWVGGVETEAWLEIDVRDDGVGFDPAAIATEPGHYGLVGMRERARLAGGTLTIDSAPGAGTRLTLRLPLSVKVPLL